MADFQPTPIKTRAAGDVQVDVTHYGGSVVGLSNGFYVRPGTGAIFDVSGSTVVVSGSVGVVGAVEVMNDAGNPLPVSGTVTATGPLTDTQLRATAVPVDTELPAAVALADNTGNPTVPGVGSFLMGWEAAGPNWDRVAIANGGRLQVDVVTGGSPSPTTPLIEPFATATDLAAAGAASQDLSTADIGTGTRKLSRVLIAGAGTIKAIIKSVVNGVETIIGYVFIPNGGGSEPWVAPNAAYATITGTSVGGNFDGFRATLFNEDPSIPFKGYATFFSEA